MRVGLDLDGTITAIPELFAVLAKALLAQGHEVYIITCRLFREDAEYDLERLGIPYTELFVPPEEDAPLVADWKRGLAEELQLDAMFEDSLDVLAAMPSRVSRIMMMPPVVGTEG